jgi:phosphoribosylaminoimidazolecarboxamide formyltransferase/IMP cyclohydrolase
LHTIKKRALLSVSDKSGITELGLGLHKLGYELVSTGGTAKLLADSGLPVTEVETVTGFPECLDGRVKTLHPHIFAGLLAMGDNPAHRQTLAECNIAPIEVMVCNLYPFAETVAKPGCTLDQAIENIDIGGPSMIRAAAKNYKSVVVVTDAAQYGELLGKIESGGMDEAYRFTLAVKAFNHTAAYDAHISKYLNAQINDGFPEQLTLTFTKHTAMRYGENPHQQAAFYTHEKIQGIESAAFLHGKELSYNNIGDANGALALIREFTGGPACAAVKHGSPCGVGTGATVFEAYMKAYECDPLSIFGGIISFNCEVDADTAKKMNELFLEVIIAPSYSGDALRILKKKKNLRLLELPILGQPAAAYEYKSAGGGLLMQTADSNDIEAETRTLVTKAAPTEAQIRDMVFGMKVVKHVKSNAIVFVRDGMLLGVGGGQTSRIWAAEAAAGHALKPLEDAVLASDAMFPMPDTVELAARSGIKAIIQPGGSINDKLSVEVCDKHGIAMVLTGVRHFKH